MTTEQLVLVVDDDDGMKTSLDALMRSLGYRTSTFRSAEELLCSADAFTADCIICDIEMRDGMSGISLAAHFSNSDVRRPVILISAYVDKKIRDAGISAGAIAVLKKPFVGEALIEIIEAVLGRAD